MRLAAMGDLHVRADDTGRYRELFAEISDQSDLLLLAGDLTDLGVETEARQLASDLAACRVPVVAVLGNHDYYSGAVPLITRILMDAGVTVLEGSACEHDGLGIAGLKGSGGGFGRMLEPIAEPEVIAFTQLAARDAAMLDELLVQMPQQRRIVLMHYAPIKQTVVGEHPEEYVFLGSSRFAEIIDRHAPLRVLHGHSHSGTFSGATAAGVPVNNVALGVTKPDLKPYAIFEI